MSGFALDKKIQLENSKIEIHPKHFDTSFIESYKDAPDNYTEGMYIFLISC